MGQPILTHQIQEQAENLFGSRIEEIKKKVEKIEIVTDTYQEIKPDKEIEEIKKEIDIIKRRVNKLGKTAEELVAAVNKLINQFNAKPNKDTNIDNKEVKEESKKEITNERVPAKPE